MNAGNATPTRDELHRDWALEQLELPAGTTPDEACRRWLEELEEEEFVPYEDSFEALESYRRGLDAEGAAAPDAFEIFYRRQRLKVVDAFANLFFRLPPRERRRQWDELYERCADCSPAAARLKTLEPGLEVAPPGRTDDDRYDELARTACWLFTMHPLLQPAAQRAFLVKTDLYPATWEMTARRVRHDERKLASLLPEFFSHLTSLTKRKREEETAAEARRERQQAAQRRAASGTHGWWPEWLWYVIPFVLIVVLSWVGDWIESSNAPSPPSYPKLSDPPPEPAPAIRISRQQIIDLFHASDEELDRNAGRATLILFGLDNPRREYRAALRELGLDLDQMEDWQEAYFDDRPQPKTKNEQLQRELEKLDLEWAMFKLQMDCVPEIQGQDATLRSGGRAAGILLKQRNLRRQLDRLNEREQQVPPTAE